MQNWSDWGAGLVRGDKSLERAWSPSKQTTSSHNHNSNTVSEVPHEERILLIVRSAQCSVYHQNLSPHKSSH